MCVGVRVVATTTSHPFLPRLSSLSPLLPPYPLSFLSLSFLSPSLLSPFTPLPYSLLPPFPPFFFPLLLLPCSLLPPLLPVSILTSSSPFTLPPFPPLRSVLPSHPGPRTHPSKYPCAPECDLVADPSNGRALNKEGTKRKRQGEKG